MQRSKSLRPPARDLGEIGRSEPWNEPQLLAVSEAMVSAIKSPNDLRQIHHADRFMSKRDLG